MQREHFQSVSAGSTPTPAPASCSGHVSGTEDTVQRASFLVLVLFPSPCVSGSYQQETSLPVWWGTPDGTHPGVLQGPSWLLFSKSHQHMSDCASLAPCLPAQTTAPRPTPCIPHTLQCCQPQTVKERKCPSESVLPQVPSPGGGSSLCLLFLSSLDIFVP